MEKELMFHILKIEETKDQQLIREAYRRELKTTNPEDDPEGFRRLREAYEEAMAFSAREEEDEIGEKTAVEAWIARVDEVYQDLAARCDADTWRELLSDPLCDGLDTSLETRETLMVYLMSHDSLPSHILSLLDETFQIREDRELLEEQFPANFLDYLIYYMDHATFFDYTLFEILNQKAANVDAYISKFYEANEAASEKSYAECDRLLGELSAFGIYHPYEDAVRAIVLAATGRQAEAKALCMKLLEEYPEDNFICGSAADALWETGEKEASAEAWERILKRMPENAGAIIGKAKWLMEQEEYAAAKELLTERLRRELVTGEVDERLRTINDKLIRQYREKLSGVYETKADRDADLFALGWCLLQNDREAEVIELLAPFVPDEGKEQEYHKLLGKSLHKNEQYEQAIPHLRSWLELMSRQTETEGGDDTANAREAFISRYLLAYAYHAVREGEQALTWINEALAAAKAEEFWNRAASLKAGILLEQKQYEQCVDFCDEIIEKNDRHYPAFVMRQEASYELGRAQQTVNDYYAAINIYPQHYKPYLVAAKVFFDYGQMEDAQGVLNRARENQVEFSLGMQFLEARILSRLATTEKERGAVIKMIREIREQAESGQPHDIEDVSLLLFETALLCYDNLNLAAAVRYAKLAIKKNPDCCWYHFVLASFYLEQEKWEKALHEYALAKDDYEDSPTFYYYMGICHKNLDQTKEWQEAYERVLKCPGIDQDKFLSIHQDVCDGLAEHYRRRFENYYRREDYERAVEYASRAVARDENKCNLLDRGRIYLRDFDFERAIADFKKALTYDPDYAVAYNNLGCCYQYAGDYETAISYFKKAAEYVKTTYRSELPYNNLGSCYRILDELEKAVECYKKNLEFASYDIHEKIGDVLMDLGRYKEALEHYEKIGRYHDDYQYHVASAYFCMGDRKKARELLANYIDRATHDKPRAYATLSDYYCTCELDLGKALDALLQAERREDQNDFAKLWEMQVKIAWLYFRLGQKENAEIFAKKAMYSFGMDSFTKSFGETTQEDYLSYKRYRPARLHRLGRIYIALGEVEDGLGMFKEMLTCNRCVGCDRSKCYESYLARGQYHEACGEDELALVNYEKGLAINPYDVELKGLTAALRKRLKKQGN